MIQSVCGPSDHARRDKPRICLTCHVCGRTFAANLQPLKKQQHKKKDCWRKIVKIHLTSHPCIACLGHIKSYFCHLSRVDQPGMLFTSSVKSALVEDEKKQLYSGGSLVFDAGTSSLTSTVCNRGRHNFDLQLAGNKQIHPSPQSALHQYAVRLRGR